MPVPSGIHPLSCRVAPRLQMQFKDSIPLPLDGVRSSMVGDWWLGPVVRRLQQSRELELLSKLVGLPDLDRNDILGNFRKGCGALHRMRSWT